MKGKKSSVRREQMCFRVNDQAKILSSNSFILQYASLNLNQTKPICVRSHPPPLFQVTADFS